MLAMGKPRRQSALSPSAPASLTLPLHLSEPCAPTSLPQQRAEAEGRGLAVSGPAVWHGPAGRSGSWPLLCFHIRTVNTPSSPCQIPCPHLRPQPTPPCPPRWARFPSTKVFFLALMDVLARQPRHTGDGTPAHGTGGAIIFFVQTGSGDG